MKRETVQKKIVYATVEALGHATTNQIIDAMRAGFHEISVATIYRNLEVLTEEGSIRKLSTNLKEDVFESKIHGEHDHFICTECGRIIDIPHDSDFKEDFDSKGNLITNVSKTYYGICKNCLNIKKS